MRKGSTEGGEALGDGFTCEEGRSLVRRFGNTFNSVAMVRENNKASFREFLE